MIFSNKNYIYLFILILSILVSSCSTMSTEGTNNKYGKHYEKKTYVHDIQIIDSTEVLVIRQDESELVFDKFFPQIKEYKSSVSKCMLNEFETILDIHKQKYTLDIFTKIQYKDLETYLFIKRSFMLNNLSLTDTRLLQANKALSTEDIDDIFESSAINVNKGFFVKNSNASPHINQVFRDVKLIQAEDRSKKAFISRTLNNNYNVHTYNQDLSNKNTINFDPVELFSNNFSTQQNKNYKVFEKDCQILTNGNILFLFHLLSEDRSALYQLAVELQDTVIKLASNPIQYLPFVNNNKIKEYFETIACDSKFVIRNDKYFVFFILNDSKNELFFNTESVDLQNCTVANISSIKLDNNYSFGRHAPTMISKVIPHKKNFLINLSNYLDIKSKCFRQIPDRMRLQQTHFSHHSGLFFSIKDLRIPDGLSYLYIDENFKLVWQNNFSDSKSKQLKIFSPKFFNYKSPSDRNAHNTVHRVEKDTVTARAIILEGEDSYLADVKFDISNGKQVGLDKIINESGRSTVHPGCIKKIDNDNFIAFGIVAHCFNYIIYKTYLYSYTVFHISK